MTAVINPIITEIFLRIIVSSPKTEKDEEQVKNRKLFIYLTREEIPIAAKLKRKKIKI